MTDKNKSLPISFDKRSDKNASHDTFMLGGIPSAIKTSEQIEQEKRQSDSSRRRKSQISKQYAEQRRMSADLASGPSIKPKPVKEISIDGRAAVKLRSQLEVDQLCCQYNADYTAFACGGANGIINIFNTQSGELVTSLSGGRETEGQTSCVTGIKHRPVRKSQPTDHCFTCTYVNGLVKHFDYNTRECLFTIKEKRQTYGLAYHPKLSKFITYGDDLKIYMYDSETQARERVFQGSMFKDSHDGPTSRVFAARFNPCSNTEFLSGGWDDTVLLWDLRAPHASRYIGGVHLCGEGLDIDKGGTKVLTCAWAKEDPLQLWDYSTFKLLATIIPDNYTSKLYCGRFITPDFLVCGGGDPSLVRIVDRTVHKSRVVITGLPADVWHLNCGKPKALSNAMPKKMKNKSKPEEETEEENLSDVSRVPKLLFTCGNKIYEADFS